MSKKLTFLNILDDISTDFEVKCHVLNGCEPGQFECITFKASGIVPAQSSEADFDLAHDFASQAKHAWYCKFDAYRLFADRYRPKTSVPATASDNALFAANRASETMAF